jgi:hypothetical protein
MTLKQCAAIKLGGAQCKRTAKEDSDFCYFHRPRVTESPPAAQLPMPIGTITTVSLTAWGMCEFCKDVYPLAALRPDGNQHPACPGCWFRAEVFKIAVPTPKSAERYIADYQLNELSRKHGIEYDAAVTELLWAGFRAEEHAGLLFYVKKEETPV